MPQKKQFLTQEWYDKKVAELHELQQVKLPAAIKKLTEASEQWDISENAEYDDALARKDLLEAKISEIKNLIDNVEIIAKQSGWSKTVSYGSTVDLLFDDEKKTTVSIVWSGEVSVENDILEISFQSPVGMAIRDKKEWDTVKVRLATGRKSVTISKIY